MFNRILIKLLVVSLVAGFAMLPSALYAQDDLDKSLAGLETQMRQGVELKTLEESALVLLDTYQTKTEIGKIYAKIARIYYLREPSREKEKIIQYCDLALRYPQDIETATDLYIHWGMTLSNKCLYIQGDTYVEMRNECAAVLLKGIKLLQDNKIPLQEVKYSALGAHDTSESNPDREAELEKQRIEREAFQRGKLINSLVSKRKVLESTLAYQCAKEPYDLDTLYQMAYKTLKSRSEADRLVRMAENEIKKDQ